MKLSNFRLTAVFGSGPLNWEFFACVDVTTGLVFKKTRTREIRREYANFWHFTDDGSFTPGTQAEELQRVWEAANGKMERST
jgi:hypothetical protein